ncbi:DUF1217 domain-containing protein [Salipiger mucosus]|uniref:Flagellar basal-body rod protein FlgF n=1 Tax=Salipiger mucosus DSM 16094 TaxID=1123237 RepID=S9QSJ6_9RHOB|nr:DUF1217 domain-containing protein [Salipiger mucosus]EPX82613.1 Flagellar basal-body rod protein FlgF [Salipiger mucosus DSM 16094]
MTFTPMIPGTGLIGWQVLQSTMDDQRRAFNSSAEIQRADDYFRENIGAVDTPEDLVNDRRLLSVALSAFGLGDKIDSKYLVQRILSEEVDAEGALATSLNDGRFTALANAFDFEKTTTFRTQEDGFADAILASYEANVLADLEIALNAPEYAGNPEAAEMFRQQVEANIEMERNYFEENIASVTSPKDLLDDRELKLVTLKAFGLEDRAGSVSLLGRVLAEGAGDTDALANVLGDEKLIALADAFSFDKSVATSKLQDSGFSDKIAEEYRWKRFEDAVTDVDPAIGAALQFQRSIPELSASGVSEDTKWFNVLGSTTMRDVFETALNLPNGFAQIDIDKQLEMIKEKAQSRYGIKQFSDLENAGVLNRVIHGYLLQEQLSQTAGMRSQQVALTLMRSISASQAQTPR